MVQAVHRSQLRLPRVVRLRTERAGARVTRITLDNGKRSLRSQHRHLRALQPSSVCFPRCATSTWPGARPLPLMDCGAGRLTRLTAAHERRPGLWIGCQRARAAIRQGIDPAAPTRRPARGAACTVVAVARSASGGCLLHRVQLVNGSRRLRLHVPHPRVGCDGGRGERVGRSLWRAGPGGGVRPRRPHRGSRVRWAGSRLAEPGVPGGPPFCGRSWARSGWAGIPLRRAEPWTGGCVRPLGDHGSRVEVQRGSVHPALAPDGERRLPTRMPTHARRAWNSHEDQRTARRQRRRPRDRGRGRRPPGAGGPGGARRRHSPAGLAAGRPRPLAAR